MRIIASKPYRILCAVLILAVLPGIVSMASSAMPGQNEQVGKDEPASGFIGYDKRSGQYLPDPSIRLDPKVTTQDQAEIQALDQEKLKDSDPTMVRFRSGYTMRVQPGIAPQVKSALREAGAESAISTGAAYYLLQFAYPFPTQARQEMEKAGYKFYDYIDRGALVAKLPTSALDSLEGQMQAGSILAVSEIPAQAKLAPELVTRQTDSPAITSDIVLLTYEPPTQEQLDQLSNWLQVERSTNGPVNILEGKVLNADLSILAGLSFVRWIEPQPENTTGNFDGRMGIGGDVVRNAGHNGSGVNVMVVDTGIARSGSIYHPDLLGGRVLDQWDYQNNDSIAADDRGHGTHIAGTIGGRYNGGSIYSIRKNEGVAPGVNFLVYKLCCDNLGFGFLDSWFQSALQRGTSGGRVTNIANNSWGSQNGVYNTSSEIADRAVRGEYNSQYVNMVVISHNDNALTRAPGTAKNVITVGAVKDGNWPNTTITSCSGVSEYDWPPASRLCFSNYGPIDTDGDGKKRVKPDLMAPGAMISSAGPWYALAGGAYYFNSIGTSMAAPHVSGAIAQYLQADPGLKDWPEVIKAVLMASAIDVGGNSDKYGRGLVDPYNALHSQPNVNTIYRWGSTMNTTGQLIDFIFQVPAGYDEVVVTLTWPDPAGAAEVVNDLDLVSISDANGLNRGFSTSSDDTVEFIRIPAGGTPGTWTARVKAFSLAQPAQSFGLAVQVVHEKATLDVVGSVEYIPLVSTGVTPGSSFYLDQYILNSGYAAGGAFTRLTVPTGFTVTNVQISTADGDTQTLANSQIYHPSGSPEWSVAVGEAINGTIRHVRWQIQANNNTVCGSYPFLSKAGYLKAGVVTFPDSETDSVSVTCPVVLKKLYLPLVRR